MASEWITQISQQYGLTCSPNGIVSGKVDGYSVSIVEQENTINITFFYFADTTERDKINKVNLKAKKDVNIATLSGCCGTSLIGTSIRLPNTPQAQSTIPSLINNYTKFFAEIGLSAERKAVPAQQPPTLSPASPISSYSTPYNNSSNNTKPFYPTPTSPTVSTSYPNHQTNYATLEYNAQNSENISNYNNSGTTTNKKSSYSTTYHSGILSVFTGVIGALIGALVGAIPWMIFLILNVRTAVVFSAFIIAGCALYGYKRLGGSSNSVISAIIITLSVIGIAVGSMFLIYSFKYASEFNCSIPEGFNLLLLAAEIYGETKFVLIFNSIMATISGLCASAVVLKAR